MIHQVEIKEWGTVDLLLPPTAIADLTRNQDKLVRVQLLPNGKTRLKVGPYVGRLRLGFVDLIVKPKVPIPSLLTMLAEAHELTRLTPQFAGFQQTDEIVDLLIHVFLNQVQSLVHRGLKRTYVNCEDELIPVRGRMDVRRTFALHMQAKPKVWCSFDEYTLDGTENRALLRTLRVISSNAVFLQHRRRVAHRLTADFVGVSDVDWQPKQIDPIVCDRLSSHYEPALRLARMILDSMGLANDFGGAQSSGFLLRMHDLFERFVGRRLAAILGSHGISVRNQVTLPFDREAQAEIRPDLVIQAKNGYRLVADTKYKDGIAPEPGDLYQMLAYCRVMKIDHGLLIVAGKQTVGAYKVRDGKNTIHVRSIDLNGPIANVNESLSDLATWIRIDLSGSSGHLKRTDEL
jgi:5-methylcytosine-specific restriction enzyme subunit McrC